MSLNIISAVEAVKAVQKKRGRRTEAFLDAQRDVRKIDDECIRVFRKLIDEFKTSDKSILQLQMENRNRLISFVRSCIQKVYIRSFEFVQKKQGSDAYLTELDLQKISNITEQTITKFWNTVQRARERIENQPKLKGAAGEDDDFLSDSLAAFLATMSANTAVLAANNFIINQVNQEQGQTAIIEEVFVYRTVGDDRVCPICEPHDGEIMSRLEGNLIEPPLHDSCRCWLEPEPLLVELSFSITV